VIFLTLHKSHVILSLTHSLQICIIFLQFRNTIWDQYKR